MRFKQLGLTRYGKFTDVELTFPQSPHDFHFIVGPNEAGKSTLRAAIAELLFGFPLRSAARAFIHPQSDLRLAATVTDEQGDLSFVRLKANKNTLRDAQEAVLPDDCLVRFLGTADQPFFEKTFWLDHTQLVQGGKSILDAAEDVSQVLFQSAAGIASLGRVREMLQREADTLWAPRASSSRAYYAASAKFDDATKRLKEATTRTKSWSEARQALDDAQAQVAAVEHKKKAMLERRTVLERVRRLAPVVQAIRAREQSLQDLGEVLDLPADSGTVLAEVRNKLEVARVTCQQFEAAVKEHATRRDAEVVDEDLLAASEHIEQLHANSQRVRDHYGDIDIRRAERTSCLAAAATAAEELGWPTEPVALAAALPNAQSVREVRRLAAVHGELEQAARSAGEALAAKHAEVGDTESELSRTPASELPATLRGALEAAQAYRNTAVSRARLQSAVDVAKQEFESEMARLQPWHGSVDDLSRLQFPSVNRLAALQTQRQKLASAHETASARLQEAKHASAAAALKVRHFAEAKHVVTAVDVREARAARDEQWSAIKTGQTELRAGAEGLDAAISRADELVDAQLFTASEAAELQTLRQQSELAGLEVESREGAVGSTQAALAEFDADWERTMKSLGLVGLALPDAQGWAARRDAVLAAESRLQEKQAALAAEIQASARAADELGAELTALRVAMPPQQSLAARITQAETLLAEADAARARSQLLGKQLESSRRALVGVRAAADEANAAYNTWLGEWASALQASGLSSVVKTVADAEPALALITTVRSNLEKADAIQRERIDTMSADLQGFATLAEKLVSRLGREDLSGADPREVVATLLPELRRAEAAKQRRETAEASRAAAQSKLADAEREVERLNARVKPLLAAAGVDTVDAAEPLVARSDQRRTLLAEVASFRDKLLSDSDGLAYEEVTSEIDSLDLGKVPAEWASVNEALEALQHELTSLAEARLRAKSEFDAIDGSANAALAEAQRQEALSEMAYAGERYIKVTVASKLLGWAIDRYREQKQGPMLSRAGAIFSTLTLGQYTRLFVDYDKEPLSLSAQHKLGRQVEVGAMSEGTRDQLYLALRLAALELHLEKSKAMPFVADDLFINFDDERSAAGLEALKELSTRTQVLFLSHHDHLIPQARQVFGDELSVLRLDR